MDQLKHAVASQVSPNSRDMAASGYSSLRFWLQVNGFSVECGRSQWKASK